MADAKEHVTDQFRNAAAIEAATEICAGGAEPTPDDACAWCGKPEAEHGQPEYACVGRLCPGATKQFFTRKPTPETMRVGRNFNEPTPDDALRAALSEAYEEWSDATTFSTPYGESRKILVEKAAGKVAPLLAAERADERRGAAEWSEEIVPAIKQLVTVERERLEVVRADLVNETVARLKAEQERDAAVRRAEAAEAACAILQKSLANVGLIVHRCLLDSKATESQMVEIKGLCAPRTEHDLVTAGQALLDELARLRAALEDVAEIGGDGYHIAQAALRPEGET